MFTHRTKKSTSFAAILHLPLPEDVLLRPCFGQAFDPNIKYTSQLESFFFFFFLWWSTVFHICGLSRPLNPGARLPLLQVSSGLVLKLKLEKLASAHTVTLIGLHAEPCQSLLITITDTTAGLSVHHLPSPLSLHAVSPCLQHPPFPMTAFLLFSLLLPF